MKIFLKLTLLLCAFLCSAAVTNGQTKGSASRHSEDNSSTATSLAKDTGKVGVIVVGSAVKGVWAATRAAGEYIVLPVAKTVFVKAAPAVGKYVIKTSAKQLLPLAVKLSVL